MSQAHYGYMARYTIKSSYNSAKLVHKNTIKVQPVSYTHLDVYKRQALYALKNVLMNFPKFEICASDKQCGLNYIDVFTKVL